MNSQPGKPTPASAMDLSQQIPAEGDHNYHVIQGNLTGTSALRKRPNDIDGDSPESSLTPAKVPAGANDAMDQGFTEGDLEGFILVEHRRQRTSGVPVLLTPADKAHRLQQQNPLILSTQVNTAAGGPIIRHRFTARGGLLVEVADATSVNKLLQVRCLGDIPIQVNIPSAYLQNYGLIKAVPTWYTDAELRDYLQPEGVIAARRLYRRRGKPGDAASPSDRVVLTFRPNTERPTKVNLGFTRHEVVEYIEAPPRLYREHRDAFELPEEIFRKQYRLPKIVVWWFCWLCDELREEPEVRRVRTSWTVMTVELQVLCALRFYGTGSFQGMVASDEHVARDQKTVSVAVRAVSVAIVRRLGVQRGWIHFPETPSERFDAERGFRLLGRIPGVIGCVDGTMVSIVGPSKNDPTVTKAAYWCRKYFYALNVMVVSTLMLRCQNAPQISRKKKNVLPIRFKYAIL
ncbi:hypothetical protein ISCGN_006916 [Ixodes scapularis]